jgi:hypothetical protein
MSLCFITSLSWNVEFNFFAITLTAIISIIMLILFLVI